MLPYLRNAARPRRTTVDPYHYTLSVRLNIVLSLILVALVARNLYDDGGSSSSNGNSADQLTMATPSYQINKQTWHGGHPPREHSGSCWCNDEDKYCLCTPNFTIDLIVTSGDNDEYVWLVRRSDTGQLATMGGFVELSENAEATVKRELQEEMGIQLSSPLSLLGIFSDPGRDNRRQTASAVFVARIGAHDEPHAGDDAKEVVRISLDEIEDHDYFSDHVTILMDYRDKVRAKQGKEPAKRRRADYSTNIARTLCASLN